MEIKDRLTTGHFDEVKRNVYLKVNNTKNRPNIKKLKIGITCEPKKRAQKYESLGYNEMHLLYRTTSRDHVRNMEKYLIERFSIFCDNSISGGGGDFGLPPYYTYIVVTKKL